MRVPLTLMLLVANLPKYKMMQKRWKMTETLAHGYSSVSTQSYPMNRVKVALALEEFRFPI